MLIDKKKSNILFSKEEILLTILNKIGLLGVNKEKVFLYIIENVDNHNLIFLSQKEIAKNLNISYPIVSDVFVTLCNEKILKKINNRLYSLEFDFKNWLNSEGNNEK